jgi:hypothetical protein
LKAELERRTGLPASVVDQVVNALGEILAERYPQYAGMLGPLLGLPTSGSATPGTTPGTTPAPGTTPGAPPSNPGLGPIPIPPGMTGIPSTPATPGTPAAPGSEMPDLTDLGNELSRFLGGQGGGTSGSSSGGSSQSTPPSSGQGMGSQGREG